MVCICGHGYFVATIKQQEYTTPRVPGPSPHVERKPNQNEARELRQEHVLRRGIRRLYRHATSGSPKTDSVPRKAQSPETEPAKATVEI